MAGKEGSRFYDVFLKYHIALDKKGVGEFFTETHFNLLKAIDDSHSIQIAADSLGISYRKAWGAIREAENHLGFPLIETHRGGIDKGGTTLTPDGLNMLHASEELNEDFNLSVKKIVKKFFNSINLTIVCLVTLLAAWGCGHSDKQEIIIFHAGSLSVPVRELCDTYRETHPGVSFITEASGSMDCARKITELKKPCDIIASADYGVIERLLIPEYASWNIPFAANEMAIVYTDHSRYAKEINADNWPEILARKEVFYGRSDANADPCGYRALFTIQLAEKYYHAPGLYDRLTAKDLNMIRPKEVDLIGLLESRALDYIFLYKSVAEQHGLRYVTLPREINLSDPALNDLYRTAAVSITGKRPGETLTMRGEAMIYGISIPKGAPHQTAALEFLHFLLDPEQGMKLMEQLGQRSLIPAVSTHFEETPEKLKPFIIKN